MFEVLARPIGLELVTFGGRRAIQPYACVPLKDGNKFNDLRSLRSVSELRKIQPASKLDGSDLTDLCQGFGLAFVSSCLTT